MVYNHIFKGHLTSGGRNTRLEYTVVDAFTSVPFTGNPAAVVLLEPGTFMCTAQCSSSHHKHFFLYFLTFLLLVVWRSWINYRVYAKVCSRDGVIRDSVLRKVGPGKLPFTLVHAISWSGLVSIFFMWSGWVDQTNTQSISCIGDDRKIMQQVAGSFKQFTMHIDSTSLKAYKLSPFFTNNFIALLPHAYVCAGVGTPH